MSPLDCEWDNFIGISAARCCVQAARVSAWGSSNFTDTAACPNLIWVRVGSSPAPIHQIRKSVRGHAAALFPYTYMGCLQTVYWPQCLCEWSLTDVLKCRQLVLAFKSVSLYPGCTDGLDC